MTPAFLALASLGGGIWVSIHGDACKFVSPDGRVASIAPWHDGKLARVLRPVTCGSYGAVGGKGSRRYVHHVVCEVFHGPRPSSRHQVRHLDGDRTNNAASNLAWGTPEENARDKERHGTVSSGERNGQARLTRQRVAWMREQRRAFGTSYADIARQFGVSTMTAYRATRGLSWR